MDMDRGSGAYRKGKERKKEKKRWKGINRRSNLIESSATSDAERKLPKSISHPIRSFPQTMQCNQGICAMQKHVMVASLPFAMSAMRV
jgi:hypothetical protein